MRNASISRFILTAPALSCRLQLIDWGDIRHLASLESSRDEVTI